MEAGTLLAELKRRRVIRALVGYGIAAFAVLQIVEPVMHGLHWPEAVLSYVVVALAVGFPVVVSLAWIFDVSAGRIERAAPSGSMNRALLGAALAGIGILASAPGLFYYFVVRERGRPAVPDAASIAVLPFVNISNDRDNEYFSDGITEELINTLANIDGLRVASRTAVFAFKGKSAAPRQIGSELNVGLLLEGSVRRENNALRVTAQLINVGDGYHLWSQTYDRELRSIFAVEDEIARAIAQALRRKLVGVKPATTSVEAHDLYLRGRFFWNKRNAEALQAAARCFEQAIGLDPDYALAYAGLADSVALRLDYDVVPASDILPKARKAARRALELNPALAEAHASLGVISSYLYEWTTALEEQRTAIELKPDYAMAHKWRGDYLMWLGRFAEAQAELERALELEPSALIIHLDHAELRYNMRDFGGAITRYTKVLEMDPTFEPARFGLANSLVQRGRRAEALAEVEKVHAFPAIGVDAFRAYVFANLGRRSEASAVLWDLEERSRREYVPPSMLALIHLGLGHYDRALQLLQIGCALHDPGLQVIKVDPVYDPLRSDRRFKQLLRCVALD